MQVPHMITKELSPPYRKSQIIGCHQHFINSPFQHKLVTTFMRIVFWFFEFLFDSLRCNAARVSYYNYKQSQLFYQPFFCYSFGGWFERNSHLNRYQLSSNNCSNSSGRHITNSFSRKWDSSSVTAYFSSFNDDSSSFNNDSSNVNIINSLCSFALDSYSTTLHFTSYTATS